MTEEDTEDVITLSRPLHANIQGGVLSFDFCNCCMSNEEIIASNGRIIEEFYGQDKQTTEEINE